MCNFNIFTKIRVWVVRQTIVIFQTILKSVKNEHFHFFPFLGQKDKNTVLVNKICDEVLIKHQCGNFILIIAILIMY